MTTFTKIIWCIGAAAFALWLLIAFILGWRTMWFRRQPMNESMATAHRQFGEVHRPVGRLRWAWIVLRSIPMLLFLTAFVVFAFFLSIPAAIWSWVTGKPIMPPDFSPVNKSDHHHDAA